MNATTLMTVVRPTGESNVVASDIERDDDTAARRLRCANDREPLSTMSRVGVHDLTMAGPRRAPLHRLGRSAVLTDSNGTDRFIVEWDDGARATLESEPARP